MMKPQSKTLSAHSPRPDIKYLILELKVIRNCDQVWSQMLFVFNHFMPFSLL